MLEDDSIIAFDLEARLLALGAAEVFVAATTEQADALLSSHRPDVGLIDWRLGAGTARELMARLVELGVGAAVVSGDPPEAIVLPENWIYLGKPVSDAELLRGVGAILKRRFGVQ